MVPSSLPKRSWMLAPVMAARGMVLLRRTVVLVPSWRAERYG